ncbi:division abnormally delayed protein [Aedes albopictus]|uniref:Heparin sulfate cell surface proteoglycan n=1 Tax=Aedes albopictus TaxID=7160 RepID=A0ABM1ZE53_AEDAL|nr:division abnormally delayed protein [Aedes albopictus]XP_029726159.1 division abnormally delayed protein [Aedes albopictus]
MHLSRGLACSQKMSWVVVLFCVLALSLEQGGVETKSVDQQELPSCDRAYGFFASINVTIKPANNDQGNVCGGSCCDNQVESQLEAKATKNFERLVKHHTRSQRGHWEQTANMYRDYLLQLSRQSENKTLSLFSTVYQKMSPLSRDPILELYGTIRNHLTSTSYQDDLELVTDKFFRDLFPVAYHHAVVHADKDVDFHSDYKNCLTHTYDDLKPFGNIPQELSKSLVASVSAASVLLRVLSEGAEVLHKLDDLGTENLQSSCKAALLKMNYCASCKGRNHHHAKPCAGLCKNVMRGCLMQYIGILNQDWYTFTNAIVPLINTVRSADGIEAEIKALDGRLSNAIMHAMENGPQLEMKVKKACGLPSLMHTDALTGAYESTGPNALLQHNKWILAPNNEMLQFEMTIDRNKDLFLQLSSTLCEDEEYHTRNEDCWTGTSLGDYTHDSAPTMSQKYNPEVPYSSSSEQFPRDSRLQMLIDKLITLKNVATKAVSSHAFKSDSDKMLSDMAEGSGDHYREDYDSNEDDEYSENGSGSGEGPRRPDILNVNVPVSGNNTPADGKTSNSNRISVSSIMLTCSVILLAGLAGSSRH